MIENIVKVKSTTTKQGAKGPYLSVTWIDKGKEFTKNAFEPAHQKVFQQAEKSGESVKVGVEKEGNYFNIKLAEITSEEVSQSVPVSTSGESKPKSETKSYTADPSKIESIEYQNARNLAVEMYGKVTEDGVPPDYELLDTIFRHINALGKDVVAVAKEQYGAVDAS